MSTFDKVVSDAGSHFAARNPNQAFDPAIIVMIAELVSQMVGILQDNCGEDPLEASRKVSNPSRLQKRLLKWRIRRTMGFRAYRKHGADVYYALLKTGKGIDAQAMSDLYDEVD